MHRKPDLTIVTHFKLNVVLTFDLEVKFKFEFEFDCDSNMILNLNMRSSLSRNQYRNRGSILQSNLK